MEHFKNIEKRLGCDIGLINCDLHPEDGEGRVGKSGLDKTLKLNEILEIAYKMNDPRPNIIIKGGKNAKWYLKYCRIDKLDKEIEKTKFRDTSRCTMFIITWD
tara:strand:+ start:1453 stop:1761 length:309 start_codon:yes stop_codon:yes gene_type:complete